MHNSRHCNDIILAGLPRSGSTLTCHLINKLPDAVALNEPMASRRFKDLPDNNAIFDTISQFLVSMRGSLENTGTAISKHIDGAVPDNPVARKISSDGLRKGEAILGEVEFNKDLPADFTLLVKHPSAFAALLPELAKRFSTYATIRNPVAVLSSWNSVTMPLRDGRAPKGEKIDPELHARLESTPDRLDRQVQLLCWFFERFSTLPGERIIRYEDIIESAGSCLSVLTQSASCLEEPLESRNSNSAYDAALTPVLVERLLNERDAAYWDYYSQSSIEAFAAS